MQTAKLFQNGRSQAVHLPKSFRLSGKEVKISKQGNKITLEPLRNLGINGLLPSLSF